MSSLLSWRDMKKDAKNQTEPCLELNGSPFLYAWSLNDEPWWMKIIGVLNENKGFYEGKLKSCLLCGSGLIAHTFSWQPDLCIVNNISKFQLELTINKSTRFVLQREVKTVSMNVSLEQPALPCPFSHVAVLAT